MSDNFWHAAAVWTAHSMIAGGAALLLAWLTLRRISDPARRRRVTGWSVRAALLACGLTLLPAWLSIPVPGWAPAPDPKPKPEPTALEAPPSVAEEPAEFVWVPVDEPWEPAVEQALAVTKPEEPTPVVAVQAAAEPEPVAEAPDMIAAVAPIVLIPYWLCVGFVVLRQVVGLIGLARLRRSASPAADDIRLRAAQLSKGVRPPRILVSDRVPSPVCFGVFRPTILLPRALARSASPDQLRWTLVHELHHLRRGDPALGVWLGFARAIFFVLPWFWVVRRELTLAQEYLADAAAAGAQEADYAAFLVELSSRPGVSRSVRAAPSLAGVRAGQSDLYRRVTMLLQPKTESKSRWGRAWSALALGSAVTAAVAVSGIRLTADEPKKTEKKTIEVRAVEGKPVETQTIEVRVVDVTKDTAEIEKAIEAAAKAGDVDAVKKLVAKLKDSAPPAPPAPPRPAVAAKPAPPPPPADGLFKVRFSVALDDETAKLEKAIEKLKQAAEEVKDQPEAKAALEKSIDAYRKRIAEAREKGELKAAEAAKNHADKAEKLHQQQGQFMKWEVVGDNQKAAMDKMRASVAEMVKVYEKQLAKFKDNPQELEALEKSMKSLKASTDELAKLMELRTGQFQFQAMPAMPPLPGAPKLAAPREALAQAYARKVPASGRLGVTIEAVPAIVAEQLDLPQGKGVIVLSILPDSAAAKAGLKGNDIILEVAGKAVTADDLPKVVADTKPEQSFEIVIVRKGKKESVKGVTLPAVKVEGKKATAKSSSMSVSVNGDQFEITAKEDALTYVLKGTVGEAETVAVAVSEGDTTKSFKGLKNVPADHREKVEKLLKSVSK